MNQFNESFTDRIHDLKKQLSSRKRYVCFDELDNLITAREILQTICKVKSNNARGLDNILNYMIKYDHNPLLPCLQKFVNACLSYKLYPTSCAHGYITVLHKSGDLNDTHIEASLLTAS